VRFGVDAVRRLYERDSLEVFWSSIVDLELYFHQYLPMVTFVSVTKLYYWGRSLLVTTCLA